MILHTLRCGGLVSLCLFISCPARARGTSPVNIRCAIVLTARSVRANSEAGGRGWFLNTITQGSFGANIFLPPSLCPMQAKGCGVVRGALPPTTLSGVWQLPGDAVETPLVCVCRALPRVALDPRSIPVEACAHLHRALPVPQHPLG